jgi:crossover junction endodeoxyribonuclease RuvC
MDPSSYRNCGWAVLAIENGSPVIKAKFTQKLEREQNDPRRYIDIYEELQKIVNTYHPTVIALERSVGGGLIFVRQNLNETVGVAKLSAARNNLSVYEVSPGTLKMLIAGHGHAPKKFIKANIVAFFGLVKAGPEHECDAMSCALAYFIDLGWQGYKVNVPYIKNS